MSQAVHVVCANPVAREGLAILIAAQGFSRGQAVASMHEWGFDGEAGGLTLLVEGSLKRQPAAVKMLVAASPNTRPVVLSAVFDFEAMTACLREGAAGYLINDISVHGLIQALHLVSIGQKVLPSTLADELSRDSEIAAPKPASLEAPLPDQTKRLSQRERDVLRCLMDGLPNKVIARELNVSEATIKANVKAILRELKVANRTEAAIWARQQGADFP